VYSLRQDHVHRPSDTSVYGSDPDLRAGLEARGLGYVLAIGCNRRVAVNHGRTRMRVDDIAAGLGRRWWHRMSAGIGAKGPRDYDWAAIAIGADPNRWLLIRRHPSTGELAYYLCWTPRPVPLAALVRVGGIRWSIEELFQAAKTHVGLDHYAERHRRLAPNCRRRSRRASTTYNGTAASTPSNTATSAPAPRPPRPSPAGATQLVPT